MARRRRPDSSSSAASPMPSGRHEGRPRRPGPRRPARSAWGVLLRVVVSLALFGHVLAVVLPPIAVHVQPRLDLPGGGPPRPTTGVGEDAVRPGQSGDGEAQAPQRAGMRLPIRRLAEGLAPYLNLLYLNHGYSFFAPEVSGSHLIDYEVLRASGPKQAGRFPDLARHWPRLRYHRHFMLAEQAPGMVDAMIAQGLPPYLVGQSYGRHLLRVHGGREARLSLIYHRLLWPAEVLAGKSPRDQDTYELRGEEQVLAEADGAAPEQPASPRGEMIRIP